MLRNVRDFWEFTNFKSKLKGSGKVEFYEAEIDENWVESAYEIEV